MSSPLGLVAAVTTTVLVAVAGTLVSPTTVVDGTGDPRAPAVTPGPAPDPLPRQAPHQAQVQTPLRAQVQAPLQVQGQAMTVGRVTVPAQPPQGAAGPRGRWQWPLAPRPAVARPFVPPRSTWGAGHRGADLAAVVGQPVRAVADGTVTHVGVIAGRPTVTVTHRGGLRSTYEPVRASVHQGEGVTAGQVLGLVVGDGSHCAPAACLHLGALRGAAYVDPLSLLGPVRVRLLPLGVARP